VDKVALITGGGSGIGRAASILFSREGAKVVILDIDVKGANETVNVIRSYGGEAIYVEGDVSDETDAKKAVTETISNYHKLNILFNNAGIVLIKDLIDMEEKEWSKVIDVNLKGMFLLSKYAIPEMIKAGGGSIINTASIYGLVGAAKYTAYCASKGAVIALTKAMAIELAPYNIRVNCICPGNISTRMLESEAITWSKIWGKTVKEAQEDFLKMQPIKRVGLPEEVAYMALFLASDESSYVTGSAFIVDGGATAQ
jgi:NAD(P)-dependent dehydrogenase (short-subunit alcohol dehydrogenase family)